MGCAEIPGNKQTKQTDKDIRELQEVSRIVKLRKVFLPSDGAVVAPHCHTPTTTPRLVREVQQTESMDLLTGFSSGAIWRNLSKDPSIPTDELYGPAAAFAEDMQNHLVW